MKAGRGVIVSSVAVAAVYLLAATELEWRTIASRSPGRAQGETIPRHVNRARLMDVVRTLASPEFEGRKTGTAGGFEARRFLARQFRDVGLEPVLASGHEQPFEFVHRSVRGFLKPAGRWRTEYGNAANVVGRLPVRDSARRAFVLSAHYDHVGMSGGVLYPGADDNASGVAVLLELARYFIASPPGRPMIFVAFDAEELKLAGAKAFMKDPPVAPGRIALNVNLDMVSRSDRNEIFAAGAYHTPALEPVLRDVQRRASVRLLFGHDRPMYRAGRVEDWTDQSDHKIFHDAGIPFVYFGVEDHADYHRPTDTAERIDETFFGDVADLIVEAVIALDRGLDK